MAAPNFEDRDVKADVAWNTEMEEELKRVLLEYGNGLLKHGDSIEELLRKLDTLEHLLQQLMQERKPLIEMALKPAEEALISNALMRHEEVDVKITVVSCITEIIRITAPQEPYDEDQMMDYFKLVDTAYQKMIQNAGDSEEFALEHMGVAVQEYGDVVISSLHRTTQSDDMVCFSSNYADHSSIID